MNIHPMRSTGPISTLIGLLQSTGSQKFLALIYPISLARFVASLWRLISRKELTVLDYQRYYDAGSTDMLKALILMFNRPEFPETLERETVLELLSTMLGEYERSGGVDGK